MAWSRWRAAARRRAPARRRAARQDGPRPVAMARRSVRRVAREVDEFAQAQQEAGGQDGGPARAGVEAGVAPSNGGAQARRPRPPRVPRRDAVEGRPGADPGAAAPSRRGRSRRRKRRAVAAQDREAVGDRGQRRAAASACAAAAPAMCRATSRTVRRVVGEMGGQHVDLGGIAGKADQIAARLRRRRRAPTGRRGRAARRRPARRWPARPRRRRPSAGSTRLDTRLAQTMPSVISSTRARARVEDRRRDRARPESRSGPPCSRPSMKV